jgi:cell fate regulator YaaT (PSP1 superfamily)
MSIFPLPVFEADADPSRRDAMTDAEVYARLKPPTSIVIRFGSMRFVAEYPYRGEAKPGCGSKLVVRTFRGTELAEMLTTTCSNSGCGKSVSRRELLEYIENSGGRDYPFQTDGQILRVATVEDLNLWSQVQATARAKLPEVRRILAEHGLAVKVVEVEGILGEEQLTVHYLSEERVDFRDAVKNLSAAFATRIEMRQVGARDEARLVADYERCGQHCCCKNFLKVLRPVSMRSAKVQKATLDPLKISGRCGRLMCCLRYEDETYEDLKKKLPKNKSRVGTPEGPGIVIDSKILVQLVLVQLEADGREVAVPVEELSDPETCPRPAPSDDPFRGMPVRRVEGRARRDEASRGVASPAPHQERHQRRDAADAKAKPPESPVAPEASASGEASGESPAGKKRRRRRRGRGRDGAGPADAGAPTAPIGRAPQDGPDGGPEDGPSDVPDDGPDDGPDGSPDGAAPDGTAGGPPGEPGQQKRRRRRRRRRGGGGAPEGGSPPPPPAG